jgi:DNA-binding IclR family transcriptional regulator
MEMLASRQHPGGVTLDEIATAVELPKSTAHRLLMTLSRHRFVERGDTASSYRLGIEAAIVGSRAMQYQRPRTEVRDLVARAASELGETVGLGVLEGRHVLVVEKGVPPRPFSWNLGVGATIPAHASAAGKVHLSGLDDSEVEVLFGDRDALEPWGPNTVTDLPSLLAELARTRRRDYAVDIEEFEEGLHCVAVPVRALDDHITHSLGISAPASRIGEDQLAAHVDFLTSLAEKVRAFLRLEQMTQNR